MFWRSLFDRLYWHVDYLEFFNCRGEIKERTYYVKEGLGISCTWSLIAI